MKITQYLVRLYPRHWRSRYEEEFLEMLEEYPISFSDKVDLLLGALDAHLHPHLGTITMPFSERMKLLLSTLRSSLLTIFCAYSGFIIAGLAFQKLNEGQILADVAQAHYIVGLAFDLVVVGAIVALLAILIGGLPIAITVVRSALTQKRPGPLLLLMVPILAFATFLGITVLLKMTVPPDNHLATFWQLFLLRGLFFGALIATAIVSTSAICLAVVRSKIPVKPLRFAIVPSALATSSMALILAATTIWGLALQSSEPHIFSGNEGIVGTSTTGTWLGIIIAMATATLLAAVSLRRGISAHSALRTALA